MQQRQDIRIASFLSIYVPIEILLFPTTIIRNAFRFGMVKGEIRMIVVIQLQTDVSGFLPEKI